MAHYINGGVKVMISKKLVISLNTAFVSTTVQTLMKCCVVLAFHQGLHCLHFIEVFTFY